MTKDEALKLVRDWIAERPADRPVSAGKMISIIDRALAQPAQEAVAWMTINEYGEEDDIHYENPEGHLLEGWTFKPLYTQPPQTQQAQSEPLEYWNAVEGWVKIDEVREHFDSVGCGTIYKTAGEDRVPVYTIPPQPAQEALYGMNQDDWKDLTDAVKKVRDGRGIYLACRPADVFQEWFLALGTAKLKDKNT